MIFLQYSPYNNGKQRWLKAAILLIGMSAGVLSVMAQSNKPDANKPHPVNNPMSPLMLAGDWVPDDTHQIDYEKLPRVPANFRVVSDVKKTNGVNQHNYLVHHGGKFWIMWSDGPGVEDRVGQRVKYATSDDGLNWSTPAYMTPLPPGSGKAAIHGTRTNEGFRYIARGFWQRGDDLIALAALDEAAEFFGPGLELHGFRFNEADKTWKDIGVIADDAINNFAPTKIATGEWVMTRRKYGYKKTGIEFLVGGVDSINAWKSFPVFGSMEGLSAEEPDWWVLPDNNLVALFRDNLRSGFLFRSFSSDNARTWSKPVRTNFPDARSKFSGIRLKDGRYALVSNANPAKRDPLVLSISDDGIVFNKMYYLTGGRHIDYPHIIEHDGCLLIAFAGEKQSVEVMKIRLSDIDQLKMISQRRN